MKSTPLLYLDYAAATPMDSRVFAAMQPYFTEKFYNPSSAYQPARDVRFDFEQARAQLGRVIGAKPDEVIITAGATESVNIAFNGLLNHGGHAVVCAMEHPAVLEAAKAHSHTIVEPTERGMVAIESIKEAVNDQTVLISVAMANSELGTVQPIKDIAILVQEIRSDRLARGVATSIFLHSDASQAAGLLDINSARNGLDLLTLNAGKCYGPKQVGLLWASSRVTLTPLIRGGGQERGIRSGTENVAGAIGFAKALQIAEEKRKQEVYRLTGLRNSLQKQLEDAFSDAVFIAHPKHRLAGHLHVAWPGLDAERVLFALEARNILVATGSACAANKGTRSHVLNAIGMPEEVADGSLRITLGRFTTESDIDRAAVEIIEVVRQERMR